MPRNDVSGSVSCQTNFLEELSFEFCSIVMVNAEHSFMESLFLVGCKELTLPVLCKSGVLGWMTTASSRSQQNGHQNLWILWSWHQLPGK